MSFSFLIAAVVIFLPEAWPILVWSLVNDMYQIIRDQSQDIRYELRRLSSPLTKLTRRKDEG